MNKQIKLKDIAKAAGVDVSTVSLCLNDSPKVAEKTKKRVKELAESMNYFPNFIAKALRGGKSNTVGICLYTLASTYFNSMLRGMQNAFYNNQFFPLVTALKNSDSKWILTNMLQRNVDGLCLCNPSQYFDLYEDFINTGKPMSIYIQNNSMSYVEGMNANFAICDFSVGTRKIFNHLFSLNHRRIGFVGSIPNRFCDYCSFLHEKNIELDERLVINEWNSNEQLIEKVESMMKTPEPPTAIFATTDNMAVDLMKILLDKGYRIPEDVSITGINDLPFTNMLKVPLTTLRIPVIEIGKKMAEMLVQQIQEISTGPQIRHFEPELIVRDSTGTI